MLLYNKYKSKFYNNDNSSYYYNYYYYIFSNYEGYDLSRNCRYVTYLTPYQPPLREIFIHLIGQLVQLSLAIPPWLGAISTGQRVVMLCDWGVKEGTAHVWWQVKLCDPLYKMRSQSRISSQAN